MRRRIPLESIQWRSPRRHHYGGWTVGPIFSGQPRRPRLRFASRRKQTSPVRTGAHLFESRRRRPEHRAPSPSAWYILKDLVHARSVPTSPARQGNSRKCTVQPTRRTVSKSDAPMSAEEASFNSSRQSAPYGTVSSTFCGSFKIRCEYHSVRHSPTICQLQESEPLRKSVPRPQNARARTAFR